MRRLTCLLVAVVSASGLFGQVPEQDRDTLEQVYLDAEVVRRVTEVARRDLPRDLLMRIVLEDIEMLRGRIDESRYRFAHFEPIEAGTISEGYSVRYEEEEGRFDRNELRARNVHALRIKAPSRRMLFRRNPDIYIDRVTVQYEDQEGTEKRETIEVNRLIEAGDSWTVPFPEVAADAIVTVFARGEGKTANMELELIRSELVDDADSPYFGAVQNSKLLMEAIGRRDESGIQSLASTLADRMKGLLGEDEELEERVARRGDIIAGAAVAGLDVLDLYLELERIEDLLQGDEGDRLEGLRRLREINTTLREKALARGI